MRKNRLEKLIESLQHKVEDTRGRFITRTIAFFDLAGSTAMKLEEGHTIGTRTALLHNLICKTIATQYNGTVFKQLGRITPKAYFSEIGDSRALKLKMP